MIIKMPQNSFCRSLSIKTKNVIFFITSIFQHGSLYIIIFSTLCIFVSFLFLFYDFLFVKQLFKAFTKFHCKHVCVMSARRIL